jgi:hypothetical protein
MEFAVPSKETFLNPIYTILDRLWEVAPGFLWFMVLIALGYIISSVVGWITRKALYKLNLDKRLRKLDLHDSVGDISIAKLASIILKWYIFILFLDQAIDFLDLGVLSSFIGKVVKWLPTLILSVTIIIAGLILIDFIIHKLLELKSKYIVMVANVIKGVLIVVVIFTAIEQLGVKTSLAQNIFLMVVASVLITFSLAFGIGLGLSLKDELKPVIKKLSKKVR